MQQGYQLAVLREGILEGFSPVAQGLYSLSSYLRGIELLPIDLMRSKAKRFTIEGNAIRPPFSSIAGVGGNAAIGIEEAQSGGLFASVEDFRLRTKANSAVIGAMRALGCFDGMPETNQLTLF